MDSNHDWLIQSHMPQILLPGCHRSLYEATSLFETKLH